MKRLLIILLNCIIFITAKSQIKALTENGREVILNENGTWQYVSDKDKNGSDNLNLIIVNPVNFSKPPGETFIVKSNVVNIGVYIDHSLWTFAPHKENEANPEYMFTMKSEKGYAMMITEKTEIDLVNLKDIVLKNAKDAAPDARILSQEYRIVNGQKVLCLQLSGTISGIKFMYLGYYYSNSNGTIQLVTYASEKLFNESRPDLEKFLNGFTEIN